MRNCKAEEGALWKRVPGEGVGGPAMPDITLTIHKGLRLHFCLDVGYRGRYVDGRLNNKERMMLHLVKDLKWRVKFFDANDSDNSLFRDWVELEAVVEGEDAECLVNALKALMRMRSLRREELEKLKAMPLRDACRELTAMLVVRGCADG